MREERAIATFEPIQLELFRDVPENFSNTIEIFDAIPKWEWRTRKTSIVETNTREFKLKNKITGEEIAYEAEIVPAILGKKTETKYAYFPGCKEEIVESALRKLFIEKQKSFFEEKYSIDETQKIVDRFGFVISIRELRNELANNGHTYDHYQILEALDILAGTRIRLKRTTDQFILDCSGESIISFTRHQKRGDDSAEQTYLNISFHSLVRQAIEKELFHAYPYAIEMQLKHQLDRWFLRRFYHMFRNASHTKTSFSISLKNTIIPEAALCYDNDEIRQAVRSADSSLERLEAKGILAKAVFDERFHDRGFFKEVQKVKAAKVGRAKIADVIYHINLSHDTIEDIINDNVRKAKKRANAIVKIGPKGGRLR